MSLASPASSTGELHVFFAASLDQVMAELERTFEAAHPGVDVRTEASGSQVAARKVSEYGRRADVVLAADWRVIDEILRPTYASWNLGFASNAIVLAYCESSRYAAEINADNWPQVLLRDDVRVARVDENLGPLGYQTRLVWQLADRHYADLLRGASVHDTLTSRAAKNLIRADVIDVLSLLGTEADYVFVYQSVAQGHNLPYLELPPEVNLADPDQATTYARVETHYRKGQETVAVTGAPIVYGATIPTNAPQPALAVEFLRLLLGPEGQAILEEQGFRVLRPAHCRQMENLPEELRDYGIRQPFVKKMLNSGLKFPVECGIIFEKGRTGTA